MTGTLKTASITLQRTIPASPAEVYGAWLDPENPGSPWNDVNKLIFDPKIDGLFYLMNLDREGGPLPHFGRFTILERAGRMEYTWMSKHTRGLESVVTLTFEPKGDGTLLTLHHAGLPDEEGGRLHESGWTYYLDRFVKSWR